MLALAPAGPLSRHPALGALHLGAAAAPAPGLAVRGDQEGEIDQQQAEDQEDQGDPVAPPGIGDQPVEQAQDLAPVENEVQTSKIRRVKARYR